MNFKAPKLVKGRSGKTTYTKRCVHWGIAFLFLPFFSAIKNLSSAFFLVGQPISTRLPEGLSLAFVNLYLLAREERSRALDSGIKRDSSRICKNRNVCHSVIPDTPFAAACTGLTLFQASLSSATFLFLSSLLSSSLSPLDQASMP